MYSETLPSLKSGATTEEALSALRTRVRAANISRSNAKGLAAFVAAGSFYALTLIGIYFVTPLSLRVAFACANGLAIGLLFIVGHDACHGALMRAPWANALLARIAFLPSLHPYVAWAYSHNALHHSWTNLKGRDPVYAPLSLEEYDGLNAFQQSRERFERSFFGVGLLYLRSIWWRLEIAPEKRHRHAMQRIGNFNQDRCLVAVFLAVHICFAAFLAGGLTPQFVTLLLFGILIPFLVWNWLIGFVTYHHHTHPTLQWFDDESEWTAFRGQILGTAHVVPPTPIDRILLHILQHPAHHVDPTVPLYRLVAAQRNIADIAMSYRWSLSECREIFTRCQLYDYRRRRWLDFAGRPT